MQQALQPLQSQPTDIILHALYLVRASDGVFVAGTLVSVISGQSADEDAVLIRRRSDGVVLRCLWSALYAYNHGLD